MSKCKQFPYITLSQMRSKSFLISFMIFSVGCVLGQNSLQYRDLENLGLSCPHKDSCASMGGVSFHARNCECDRACSQRRDCCIDADRRTTLGSMVTASSLACIHLGKLPNIGVYAIDRCPENFEGPAELRRKCHAPSDLSDPMMEAVPITDSVKNVTYKNRYCSECNGALPLNQVTWQILLACEGLNGTDQSTAWSNLKFKSNRWVVELEQRDHTCKMAFEIPDVIKNQVKLCRSNLISSCPSNWRRRNVQRMCNAYMAIVGLKTMGNVTYRNPHCAMCNGVEVAELTCDRGVYHKKKIFSLALLLDINRIGGDRVGVTNTRCSSNQKYDPFFQRCRTLVCALPGYKVEEGRCVSGE